MWIASNEAFAAFCAEANKHDMLGIDLEFQGEGRYTPQLCLVQLAVPGKVAAVDPFKVNLSPLAPLLKAERIRKIFHAGSQDIAILHRETGVAAASVLDTQTAAAFLGFGESVGYGPLVSRVLRISLDKRQRFTDWTRRPLSPEQIDYALNDVRHLLTLTEWLSERLEERRRMDWVLETCAEMVAAATQTRSPESAYLRLGRLSGLSRRELGVLRELAAWREYAAQTEGRPVGSIMNDDALRQVCFALPKAENDLRQIRGVRENLPRHIREGVLEAVRHGLAVPENELPEAIPAREPDSTADAVASLLGAVVRSQAVAADIAPTLIANRDDLLRLAVWSVARSEEPRPDLKLLSGWRAEAVGNLLMRILTGEVLVGVDAAAPGGVFVREAV